MTYRKPTWTDTTKAATTVTEEGWSVIGVLDGPLSRRLEQPDGVPILGPAGTVAVFDARLWHRRRDNLGSRTRRAMFMAYSYRWLTSRDVPFECVSEWANLSPIRRQLLGDNAVDPFYWASGELPLDPRAAGLREAA